MPHQEAASTSANAGGLGDNKGIKFQISVKGNKWNCILQPRAHYEATKSSKGEKEGETTESGTSTTTTSSSASTVSS